MNINYYSFGMRMPERSNTYGNTDVDYRYAFQGMEQDNEVSDNGNSYTTEFRQYDPRLGRWKSLDPLMAKYPGMSPYVAFNNSPIYFTDPLGLEGGPTQEDKEKGTYTSKSGTEYTYDKELDEWYMPEANVRITIYPKAAENNVTNESVPNNGGTISVPTNSYQKRDDNGDLRQFVTPGKTYSYEEDDDGVFIGYLTPNGEKYTGEEILDDIPWYFVETDYSTGRINEWPVYGDPDEGQTEFETDIAASILFATTMKLLELRIKKKLKIDDKGLSPEFVGDGSGWVVKSSNVSEYAESRVWQGYGYISPFTDASYFIPTGLGEASIIRVGAAKIVYKVFFNGIDTGMGWTDTLDRIEKPSTHPAPKSTNKH